MRASPKEFIFIIGATKWWSWIFRIRLESFFEMVVNQLFQSTQDFKILTIIFCATTLVFSQVSAEIEQGRTCHWCGPLAEQVHRSRRAPACGGAAPDHTTLCDPGFTHCATVATAPPQVISRYCVKLYQDECYWQFCNTTQTWKMTCPCKGDFCNGDIGEREREAFLLLAKLAAKTHTKIKKRTATAKLLNEHNDNIDNPKLNANLGAQINETNAPLMGDPSRAVLQTPSANFSIKDELTSNIVAPTMPDVKKETNIQKNNSNVNALNEDKLHSKTKDLGENEVIRENKLDFSEENHNKNKENIPPKKAIENKFEGEINAHIGKDIEMTKEPEPVHVTESTIISTKLEAKLPVNSAETKPSVSNVKPTEKLPSESLQQNVTPKTDTAEKITTTEVTDTEGPTTIVMPTTPAKPTMKKNNSARNNFQLTSFFISSITSYFLF